MSKLVFETVINKDERVNEKFAECDGIIQKYKVYENDTKVSLNIPLEEFASIRVLLRQFNKSIYIALAYITDSKFELVFDEFGQKLNYYPARMDGCECRKYVKKKFFIRSQTSTNCIEISGYKLDFAIESLVKSTMSFSCEPHEIKFNIKEVMDYE